MMNYTWSYKILHKSDLPLKAQRFIDLLNLDISNLSIWLLKADPNGKFIKDFRQPDVIGLCEYDNIYFINDIPVGVAIHELTHYYLEKNKVDIKAICNVFINTYGARALSNNAIISYYNNEWEEILCEIVGTYGRRGQFDKITMLLKPSIIEAIN